MGLSFLCSLLIFIFLSCNSPLFSAQPLHNISSFSSSDSPWQPTQSQILLSPKSIFAAGFRPAPQASNFYIFSIWYHNISVQTDAWSANLNSPVSGNGSLSVTASGELRLGESSGNNLWPGNTTGNLNSTKLTLTDRGELVYGNWLSFRYPTNTFLPNQQINGSELVSRSGRYKFKNAMQLVFNDSASYWNTNNAFQQLDDSGKVLQENGAQQVSSDVGATSFRRLTLDDDGNLRVYSFQGGDGWVVVWLAMPEICKIYGTCGANSICMNNGGNSKQCICPPGFRPRGDSEHSCDRKIQMTQNTKFLRLDYVNFSGGYEQMNQNAQNFSVCESSCRATQDCLGFGYKYDGSGYCVLQRRWLLYGYWSPGTETAMYLRVDHLESDNSNFTGMTNLFETTCPVRISLPLPPKESDTTTRNIVIICTLFAAELISGVLFFSAFLKKYIKYRDMARTLGLEFLPAGGPKRFTFAELKAATNDFSDCVGKGGFGDVYKGELPDHRIVAVKCLKNVTGGDREFWAEVTIIARMHHLNLVRLWGFCAEKGRRILVYEYVPKGSLDKFLFPARRTLKSVEEEEDAEDKSLDPRRPPILDWNIRYRIALGVARAIAYLHEECLEWVLHCDIKPENILLGDDFCPKISDFGLAKLKKKEDMVSMSKIRGTRGYMAPEWVKMDPITPKADVYSFGMVLLEIVSGRRNYDARGSLEQSEDWYFPRWAFDKVFKEMKVEDLLDPQIIHCYDNRLHFDMVDRMVKTAMWCLQDRVEMRPSMGKVAKMLEGTVEMTEPKKPTIFFLAD